MVGPEVGGLGGGGSDQGVQVGGIGDAEGRVGAAPAGDRAAEVGRGDIFTAPGKPPITVKYVVLWKQEGGAWKWDVDCWNLDA